MTLTLLQNDLLSIKWQIGSGIKVENIKMFQTDRQTHFVSQERIYRPLMPIFKTRVRLIEHDLSFTWRLPDKVLFSPSTKMTLMTPSSEYFHIMLML